MGGKEKRIATGINALAMTWKFDVMKRYRAAKGSNDYRCTVHELSVGTADKKPPVKDGKMKRYRAGKGSHETNRTVHELSVGTADKRTSP